MARAIARTPAFSARINPIVSRSSRLNARRTPNPCRTNVGFTPPASRNHLFPASFDTPTPTPASPGDNPDRTNAQN